jgi:hypothetical protein
MTGITSFGNAAQLSGSSTNVSTTRSYVHHPPCNFPHEADSINRREIGTLTTAQQGLQKKIPDQPTNVTPVELRSKQIFADVRIGPGDGKPFVAGKSEAKQ